MSQPEKAKDFWLSSFNEPASLVDLPVPSASPGSVVLQVLATSINPFTNHVHAGHILLLNLILPLVPNPSCIARVHSVGADAVHLKAWDLVYVDPTVVARGRQDIMIMQGHSAGDGAKGSKLFSV
jgi:NADPH:quinone reductase-like Zn-dependent oxidoreductase